MADQPNLFDAPGKLPNGFKPFGSFRRVQMRPVVPLVTSSGAKLAGEQQQTPIVSTRAIEAPQPISAVALKNSSPINTPRIANRFVKASTVSPPERITLTERHKKTEAPAKQILYQPGSKFASTGAMIPSDVATAMQNALAEFEARYGDIDSFVANGLGITKDQLNRIMSAEQIDAVALGVAAALENRGFIVGDQTGFGKGRIIVCISVIVMRLLKRPTIFSTEKATLFSDLFRDIRDTGTDLEIGDPLLLNAGSKIIDMSNRQGHILYKHSPKRAAEVIRSGKIPAGTNLFMTTYTQFSRPGEKQDFLLSAAENAHLLNDEAQNLVGDSAVGNVYSKALALSASSTFSSATFARHVTNLSAYGQVMPWLESFFLFNDINPDKLAPNFRRSLSEASLLRAISDGGLIRREHNMSSMKLNMEDVGWENDEHEVIADKLAEILQQMMLVSKIVTTLIDRRNLELSPAEVDAKALWTYANFGSRMSLIGSQWDVAMMISGAIDFTVKVLLSGQKPALVVDSTMEALMKEVLDLEDDQDAGAELGGNPSFRDSLSLVAKNLLKVRYKPGVGRKSVVEWVETPDLIYKINMILNEIAAFPDLPLSPLDALRQGIENAGKRLFEGGKIDREWKVGEISGRTLCLTKEGKIESFDPGDRNGIVSQYVNGGIDVLILTRAGAVGLSAHDSASFADHKQRHMIELKPPRNILERVQMWGRVFRRGQLTEPVFTALSLPLPMVVYEIASQNKKLAELSASVSGNAKSLTMSKGIDDPIDAHGDMAAVFMLSRDPDLRTQLWMGAGGYDDGSDDIEKGDGEDFPTVSKMMRRMRMLPVHRQRQVFDDFWIIRDDMLRTFPIEPSVLDGIWEIRSENVLDPSPRPGRPSLREVKIRGERLVEPITEARLNDMLALGETKYRDVSPIITQHRLVYLDRVKTRDMPECPSLAAALASPSENAVTKADKTITALTNLLKIARTGVTISMPPGDNGRPVVGVITEVTCKNLDDPCLPQNHIISIAAPGEEKLRRISFDTIISKPDYYRITIDPSIYTKMMDDFRNAKPGILEVSRTMLMGEPVEEAFASIRLTGGSRVSFRTLAADGTEIWHAGILVPKRLEPEVSKLAVVVRTPAKVIDVLRIKDAKGEGCYLTSSGMRSRNVFQFGPVFTKTYGDGPKDYFHLVAMITPSHTIADRIEAAMKNVIPSFRIKRAKDEINMSVKTTEAAMAIEVLMSIGVRLHADANHRRNVLREDESPTQEPAKIPTAGPGISLRPAV